MDAYSVTVGTSAVGVCPTDTYLAAHPNTQFAGTASVPASIHVQNTGTNPVFLGGPGVTTADGFPLAVSASIEIDLQADALYAIAAAGGEEVTVLRTS